MARELLDESSSDSDVGGASIEKLQINSAFAKRFEHNKKREELAKLEEKHGKSTNKRKRNDDDAGDDSDTSSSSENEDDAGELATAALDGEIMATLNAIRSKDPRVYDGKSTFYSEIDQSVQPEKAQKEKPMYLRDYHRENLVKGENHDDVAEPMSYDRAQEHLKDEIRQAMHAAVEDSDSDEEGGLLVAKKKKDRASRSQPIVLNVEEADRDPENFLSNFMAARAWVPTEKASYQPFESDDDEDDRRAEEYEEAYNMRFEDPEKSNEKLRTHARDMAARYSVRRDDKNSRQKKRDEKKSQKEIEKAQLKEEKARLRKLRIEEIEEKVKKIKQAAGLKSTDLQPEDWADFVNGDWDDARWEEEMQRRFGDGYYAEQDAPSDEGVTRAKPRKPRFDDDIDINDIVPDFVEDKADFSLSDEEDKPAKKSHKKEKEEKKKASRRERRIIEQLADDQLQMELDSSIPGVSKNVGFRYRDTSPQSFGLTSRDILLAEDTQLNQFAGIKKLASFRDPEKKTKDQRHLGKRARLRKWRKETFGSEDGVEQSELVPEQSEGSADDMEAGGVDIRTSGKKKRRRSKKQKIGESEI